MSEKDSDNVGDSSPEKDCLNKKTSKDSEQAAENETRANETSTAQVKVMQPLARTQTSNPSLPEDKSVPVGKNSNDLSKEGCGEEDSNMDSEMSGKDYENIPFIDSDCENSELKFSDKKPCELKQSDTASEEHFDSKSATLETGTASAEESLGKLKMNIQKEEGSRVNPARGGINITVHYSASSQRSDEGLDRGIQHKEGNISGPEASKSKEQNEPSPEAKKERTATHKDFKQTGKTKGHLSQSLRGKSDTENVDSVASGNTGAHEHKKSEVESSQQNIRITESDHGGEKIQEQEDGACAAVSKGKNKEEASAPVGIPKLSRRLAQISQTWSERDTQMYRDGYPGKPDYPTQTHNWDFYLGKRVCEPDGLTIDEIHEQWWDDYRILETRHGYIQWLFPIRESGMNWRAQELQLHEAEKMKADEEVMTRFKKSYEMMLNFYGLSLVSEETGEVKQADNCKERFYDLNNSMHNYLRITRILKCLGELGLEHFKTPFLRLVLKEAVFGRLKNTLTSCYNFWIGTVRDPVERQGLKDYANHLCLEREEREDVKQHKLFKFPGCAC